MTNTVQPKFKLDGFSIGDTFIYREDGGKYKVRLLAKSATSGNPNYLDAQIEILEVFRDPYHGIKLQVGRKYEIGESSGSDSYFCGWTASKE